MWKAEPMVEIEDGLDPDAVPTTTDENGLGEDETADGTEDIAGAVVVAPDIAGVMRWFPRAENALDTNGGKKAVFLVPAQAGEGAAAAGGATGEGDVKPPTPPPPLICTGDGEEAGL